MSNNTNYVSWNGMTESSSPIVNTEAESLTWGEVDFTWDDIQLLGKIASHRRGRTLEDYLVKQPDNKKKLIRLICKVKGIEVYDEQKEAEDIKIDVKDIDLLINEVFKQMIVT